MFLKSAKINFFKNKSITTQLTLVYSLTTFVLITAIAFFIYGTMVHILHNANSRFLSNEVVIITKLLKEKKLNLPVLQQKIIDVPYTETGSDYHYYIRIIDGNNKLFIETPQMGKVFQYASFFKKNIYLAGKEKDWWDAAGRNYLLIQSPVNRQGDNKVWRIQIALDISYQQFMVRNYHIVLLFCLIAGALIAVFLGYLLARNSMRSLFELTEATKKITATSLNQRIDPESWPRELKELAIAYNQMLKRIESSFSRLMEFSADLAHELRTPVNNLMGETEVHLTRTCSVDEYQQVLESNLEELHRISKIVENLLFLARTENTQLTIAKENLNLAAEIKLICEYYQAVADEKNIKISCENNAVIEANSIMFRRAISNILSNALKYTPINGCILIKINETSKNVCIEINDNGVGIASLHLPKIFNRFYRVDLARSKQSGGTGLGLAIAKSIMEAHQGSISLRSTLLKGTSVLLIFPK